MFSINNSNSIDYSAVCLFIFVTCSKWQHRIKPFLGHGQLSSPLLFLVLSFFYYFPFYNFFPIKFKEIILTTCLFRLSFGDSSLLTDANRDSWKQKLKLPTFLFRTEDDGMRSARNKWCQVRPRLIVKLIVFILR